MSEDLRKIIPREILISTSDKRPAGYISSKFNRNNNPVSDEDVFSLKLKSYSAKNSLLIIISHLNESHPDTKVGDKQKRV